MSISSETSYFTFGGYEKWYEIFSTKGWKTNNNIDAYLFMNTALLPNSNLIAGLSTFDINTGGLKIRRVEYLKSIINNSLAGFTYEQSSDERGKIFENYLQLYNVGTIISFKSLFLPHFAPVQSKKKGDITITVYKNMQAKNNVFYIPTDIRSFLYIEDVEKEIMQETVSEQHSFAESLPKAIKQSSNNINIQIINQDDQYLKGTVNSNEKKFIAVKKGWYPEWHLYIDGKESPIYKTNLIHMGFFVPQGRHVIELRYVPMSFYVGCAVALLGVVCAAVLLILSSTRRRGSSR